MREYLGADYFYEAGISPVLHEYSGNWVIEVESQVVREVWKCQMTLGAFEYNLLRSWADEYFNPSQPHFIQTLYEENSIVVNMGPGSDFTWCGESKQKMSLTMKNSTLNYCKQVINMNFKVLEGQVRINFTEFQNCNNDNQDLDEQSFQCVDWKDMEMSISLNLNECHENTIITRKTTRIFRETYENMCQNNQEKCNWIGDSVNFGKLCSAKENANNMNFFTPFTMKKLRSLKATKFTGSISMREDEGNGRIFFNDSKGNLQCLNKRYEIHSLGKK